MTFKDKVKIMFNFAMYPEVKDVFIQEHNIITSRFISIEIGVGTYSTFVQYEADPDESANRIICRLDKYVRCEIERIRKTGGCSDNPSVNFVDSSLCTREPMRKY